jgi:alpha-beta hydrolase superfamily lysophospholipase
MLQRLMIRVLGRLWPRRTFASGIEPEALSRDPEVVRRYVEDPLIDPRITVSLAAEMMAAAGRIAGRGADVPLPVLLLHGESDSICSPAGSESFFAARTLSESKGRAGESGRQYWNRLHVYPELRHEIFNEPEREAVFGDLLKWVDELGRVQTPGDHGMEGSPEDG